MACMSDESWVSLPKMLSERMSLTGEKGEEENKNCFDSKTSQYRLENVFPVYALGVIRPDSDSVLRSDDPVADPIWDAVKEEAKLEVQTPSPILA